MINKKILLLLIIIPLLFSCKPPPQTITLTIGANKNLAALIPEAFSGQELTWTSDAPDVVSVTDDGVITALKFTGGGSDRYVKAPATGTATITVTSGRQSHSMAVHTTVKGSEDIMDLPPFKDLFGQYFMMGNIFNPRDVASNGSSVTNEWLTHHYNILTPENNMKPSTLTNARDAATGEITYNFATADRMVNAALASGIKVHGHTLLWHQQIPKWQEALATADKATALNIMKKYITEVVTHFKGKIYSWDVLNEVVPDGGRSEDWTAALRQENPWYKSIGADFVYEAYLAARLADPSVILYYNDYNLDQGGKSGTVYSMVYAVNAKYKQAYPRETRLLIEGIGMQSHHNTNVSVVSIRNSIDRFRQLGVKLSVSELDILGQGWSEFRGSTGQGVELDDVSSVTNRGIMDQARLFGEYMKLYIDNADIIERVALWGVTDDRSWRSGGVPLLFDHNGKAKPGYYTFVGALNAKPAE